MAMVIIMEWKGVSAAQYDALKSETNFEHDMPPGGLFHVAAVDGDTMRVCDVWNSAEQFQAFVDSKLMPATQKLGITSQPDVKVLPAHNIFTPGYTAK